MTQIKDYFFIPVGVCLISGVLTLLTPDGKFEKPIRLIGGLFFLLCLLTPLANTLRSVASLELDLPVLTQTEFQDESRETATDLLEQTTKKEMLRHTETVLGHPPVDARINVSYENGAFIADQADITLAQTDMGKARAVADYLNLTMGLSVTVISG